MHTLTSSVVQPRPNKSSNSNPNKSSNINYSLLKQTRVRVNLFVSSDTRTRVLVGILFNLLEKPPPPHSHLIPRDKRMRRDTITVRVERSGGGVSVISL